MKKTLLALAALAATSASFAQSSLTIYGVVDVSVERVKGDHQATLVSSDNLAGSRLGFKGTEDMGDGMKASFVLESGVKVDTGANNGGTTRFFDRSAWLGLSGGAGELRLGRQDSSIGAIAGDSTILGAQAYDDLKIVGTRAGAGFRRVDNAATYIMPKLVDGVTSQVQYSTAADYTSTANAENTHGSNFGKNFGLNVRYAGGPISAGLGYLSVVDVNSTTAGNQRANAVLIYGGYDLGMAKLTAYYDGETSLSTSGTKRFSLYGLKATVPVTADLSVMAGVSKAKNIAGAAATNDDAVITSLRATYNLSKRTAVYGLVTAVNNEDGVAKGVSSLTASNGAMTGGVAVGVRHTF